MLQSMGSQRVKHQWVTEQQCPCVTCVDSIFVFDLRAVFGLDACCLFPQPMLAVVPLIGGVRVLAPREARQWLPPNHGSLALAAASRQSLGKLATKRGTVGGDSVSCTPGRWEQWLVPGHRVLFSSSGPSSFLGMLVLDHRTLSSDRPCWLLGRWGWWHPFTEFLARWQQQQQSAPASGVQDGSHSSQPPLEFM